jgi:threonine/homoserine/homoserine lactone efflux protein
MSSFVAFFSPSLLFAYAAYFVACASPGPSILAIMGMAMNAGRRPALTFAMGIMCGSMFWAVLTALGLSATLARYSQLLIVLKLLGGFYLLWLAAKSARSAFQSGAMRPIPTQDEEVVPQRLFLRGLGFHLTNPKAILSWLSIYLAVRRWLEATLAVVFGVAGIKMLALQS